VSRASEAHALARANETRDPGAKRTRAHPVMAESASRMALGPGSHSRLRLACHCDSRALAWPGHVTGDRLCGFATVLWRVPGERSETRDPGAKSSSGS